VLRVRGLRAYRGGREILRGVDLDVGRREVLVVFGPNGAGKSALLSTIMGVGGFRVEGTIAFEGEDITRLPPHERARRGIALAYQFPPEIEGVRVSELAKTVAGRFGGSSVIDVGPLAERELFVDMSGGEKKLVEAYITSLMNPRLVMLDEPDSGLDIDNVGVLARQINEWIAGGVSVILVTHTGRILDYIDRADRAAVIVGGRVVHQGSAYEVYETVAGRGYDAFRCG